MLRQGNKLLYTIVLGALLLRTVVPLASYAITGSEIVFHDGDTHGYVALAGNLIALGQFTGSEFAGPGIPEIVRTPGYPLFLIPGVVSGRVELVTIALQVIASCFTVYLVYGISRALFGPGNAAAIAAALYAVEPLSILYSSILLTETLFTTAIVLSCYFFVRHSQQPGVRDIACAGAALSAAVFIRPIAYHLVFLAFAVLTVSLFHRQGVGRKALVLIFVFLIVTGGPTAAWQVRNHIQTGYWGFSAISVMGLHNYLAGGILALKKGIPLDQQIMEMEDSLLEKYPRLRDESLTERLPYMREEALKILGESPLLVCRLLARRAIITLAEPVSSVYVNLFVLKPMPNLEPGLVGYLKRDRWMVLLNVTFFIQLVAYWALAGVALMSRKTYKTRGLTFFLLMVAYLFVASVVGGYYSRFRHPLMPFVCVLSGYGAVILYERTKQFLSAGSVEPER